MVIIIRYRDRIESRLYGNSEHWNTAGRVGWYIGVKFTIEISSEEKMGKYQTAIVKREIKYNVTDKVKKDKV